MTALTVRRVLFVVLMLFAAGLVAYYLREAATNPAPPITLAPDFGPTSERFAAARDRAEAHIKYLIDIAPPEQSAELKTLYTDCQVKHNAAIDQIVVLFEQPGDAQAKAKVEESLKAADTAREAFFTWYTVKKSEGQFEAGPAVSTEPFLPIEEVSKTVTGVLEQQGETGAKTKADFIAVLKETRMRSWDDLAKKPAGG